MVQRQPVPQNAQPKFPFGQDFQKSLLRLLCEDTGFAHQIVGMLDPLYFENEVLSWAFHQAKDHVMRYGGMPSLHLLIDQARRIDPRYAPLYTGTLETVREAPMRDAQWLRVEVVDFVKRNIFVTAVGQVKELFNAGKVSESYDYMMAAMDHIHRTTWKVPDRSVFFKEIGRRMVERSREGESGSSVVTGFPHVDAVLDGGLSPGELGIWIAYAKHGKSTILVNHGVAATRVGWKKTAHFVFEGSRKMVENRYDAAFMDEFYRNVKRGDIDQAKYARAVQQYHMMGDMLVVQGFTEEWDYSVVDVHDTLKQLKTTMGWEPDVVIVDYGDLLRGREKSYRSETEKQKSAFRDLKSLANRGYAVWTASQAQRPEKNSETDPHLLRSRQIADCYEKVRVADFLGSLNMTLEERKARCMALYCELYRDNEADLAFMVKADLEKMIMREDPTVVSPHGPGRCDHRVKKMELKTAGRNGQGLNGSGLQQTQAQFS